MKLKIYLVLGVFIFLVLASSFFVSATTQKQYLYKNKIVAPHVQETCWKHPQGKECTAVIYSTPKWILENGTYKNFTDVVKMSFNKTGGYIHLAYSDKYWVNLMPFFILKKSQIPHKIQKGNPANDIRDVLAQKESYTNYYKLINTSSLKKYIKNNNIKFNTIISKHSDHYVYDLNFSGIPLTTRSKLKYVGLKLVNSSGLTWNDITIKDKSLIVKNKVRLNFNDLVRHNFSLQLYDKRTILIGNVANKENLWLDPTINYFGKGTAADTYVSERSSSSNYGSEDFMYIGTDFGDEERDYIRFNLSNLSSKLSSVTEAMLYLYQAYYYKSIISEAYFVNDSSLSNSWTESGITWNNQPCGNTHGSLNNSCNNTLLDSNSNSLVQIFNITTGADWIVKHFSYPEQALTIVLIPQDPDTDGNNYYSTKEEYTESERPYLNITYTTNSPPNQPSNTFWNETSVKQNKPALLNTTANDPDDNEDTVWATIDYPDSNTLIYSTSETPNNITAWWNHTEDSLSIDDNFDKGVAFTSQEYSNIESPDNAFTNHYFYDSATYGHSVYEMFKIDFGNLDVNSVQNIKITWKGNVSKKVGAGSWEKERVSLYIKNQSSGTKVSLLDSSFTQYNHVLSIILENDISDFINTTTKEMFLKVVGIGTALNDALNVSLKTDYLEVAINTTRTNITLSRTTGTDFWTGSFSNTSQKGTYSVYSVWINDTAGLTNYTAYCRGELYDVWANEGDVNQSFIVTEANQNYLKTVSQTITSSLLTKNNLGITKTTSQSFSLSTILLRTASFTHKNNILFSMSNTAKRLLNTIYTLTLSFSNTVSLNKITFRLRTLTLPFTLSNTNAKLLTAQRTNTLFSTLIISSAQQSTFTRTSVLSHTISFMFKPVKQALRQITHPLSFLISSTKTSSFTRFSSQAITSSFSSLKHLFGIRNTQQTIPFLLTSSKTTTLNRQSNIIITTSGISSRAKSAFRTALQPFSLTSIASRFGTFGKSLTQNTIFSITPFKNLFAQRHTITSATLTDATTTTSTLNRKPSSSFIISHTISRTANLYKHITHLITSSLSTSINHIIGTVKNVAQTTTFSLSNSRSLNFIRNTPLITSISTATTRITASLRTTTQNILTTFSNFRIFGATRHPLTTATLTTSSQQQSTLSRAITLSTSVSNTAVNIGNFLRSIFESNNFVFTSTLSGNKTRPATNNIFTSLFSNRTLSSINTPYFTITFAETAYRTINLLHKISQAFTLTFSSTTGSVTSRATTLSISLSTTPLKITDFIRTKNTTFIITPSAKRITSITRTFSQSITSIFSGYMRQSLGRICTFTGTCDSSITGYEPTRNRNTSGGPTQPTIIKQIIYEKSLGIPNIAWVILGLILLGLSYKITELETQRKRDRRLLLQKLHQQK